MLGILLPWRQDGRAVGFAGVACAVAFAGVAFVAGCDDAKDGFQVVPPGGAGGAGASGAGAGGAGSGGDAGAGGTAGAGAGGGAGGTRDAGADAAPPTGGCVVGTLEQYCSLEPCPEFDDARSGLRRLPGFPLTARVIVQRACTAPNGAARISVSADYVSASLTYIYDAATQALVGVEFIDDLGLCSGADVEFGEPGFGTVSGYYGEESRDCGSGHPSFRVPEACSALDAGVADDAGPDAGPTECILTEP